MDVVEMQPGSWRIFRAGARVGEISLRYLGRHRRIFYRAQAVDEVEIGYFATLGDAHAALLADDAEGCPRDPVNPRMRRAPGWRYE
jgi:hypothetical protein